MTSERLAQLEERMAEFEVRQTTFTRITRSLGDEDADDYSILVCEDIDADPAMPPVKLIPPTFTATSGIIDDAVVCDTCGSQVSDSELHTNWHRRLQAVVKHAHIEAMIAHDGMMLLGAALALLTEDETGS